MSSLANQQQNLTYPGLLQIPGGITSALQQVQDGNGNATGLSISSTGASVTTSNTSQASKNGITYTGATARLISDMFGDLPTVKDFGAKGDGTTDDTAAFTAAIAASPTGVAAPAGSYKITGTVTGNFYSFGVVTVVTGTVTTIQNLTTIPAQFSASTGSTLVGTKQSGAGATARTVAAKLNDNVSVKDFGAIGDGTTDDSAAFTAASTNGAFFIPAGTYRINSNISLNSAVQFQEGAILKPASGIIVTFTQVFTSAPVQIFNLTLGGSILPSASNRDVYAEWWGAKGDGYLGVGSATLNNNVYIQQAIDAIKLDSQGVAGGYVLLAGGDYYVSAQINIPDYVSIKGSGTGRYPCIFANTSGWAANSYMFYSSNGTLSMFNSTIENVRINANNQANILSVVYSVAWQEKCGFRNVVIENFQNYGFLYTQGYGGAASLRFENVEFFASASAVNGDAIIRVDSPNTVGYLQLNIDNATITGTTSKQTGLNGISVSGSVILNLNNVHFEALDECILLQNRCILTGQSVTASGNNDVNYLISCESNWTGSINANYIQQCGASGYITDSNRPYPIAAVPPYNGQLIWPPDPKEAFAVASLITGSSPVISYGYGMTVSRSSAGVYVFTLNPAAYTLGSYNVVVSSNLSQSAATKTNSSTFTVNTRDASGVAADFNTLSVQVFHSS